MILLQQRHLRERVRSARTELGEVDAGREPLVREERAGTRTTTSPCTCILKTQARGL